MQTFEERLVHWIDDALAEDIGSGDHSTLSCIPVDAVGKAVLLIKQSCVLAGIAVAEQVFSRFDPSVQWEAYHKEGDKVIAGEKAFVVKARMHTILQCERLVLNTMQRMSGIATLTARYVEKLHGFSTRILDTRKTTPNFRFLEKQAVRIGGGSNHRMGLYDMIMLKDNHIDFCGGILSAIERAYAYVQRVDPALKIEVETRTMEEVKAALQSGKVNRILLDNFTPALLKEAVEYIGGNVETEASGGIHLDNIQEYASTGVDFISVGALIHQAQSIDMSLKAF
jgi:nicotinate-nucleotide pyrophosphorylase (carboxylating)